MSRKLWKPALNPAQERLFNDSARHVLGDGEKGSGKTVGGLNMLVRHAVENESPLCVIITPSLRTGSEGLLYDLTNLVLPAWAEGNRYPRFTEKGEPHPYADQLMDDGTGLEYTDVKIDGASKDRYLNLVNCYGKESKIILFSLPYESAIEPRLKAIAPSFALVDELTDIGGPEYLELVGAQLGRRRGVRTVQQYVGLCNPKGPNHWVYQRWFVDKINDPSFSRHHIPVTENLQHIGPDYVQRLQSLLKHPVQRRRLLDGEWVDYPEGDTIFGPYFIPEIHVVGDRSVGLIPLREFPVLIGYDPGPVNFSIHFMQWIPLQDGDLWTVFDEMNFVSSKKRVEDIVPQVLANCDYWQDVCGSRLSFLHICDESAWFPQSANYGAQKIERVSNYKIRLHPCPRGKDTVPSRVQLTVQLLMAERLLISARCTKTIDMFTGLVAEPPKEGVYDPFVGLRPQDGPHKHPFDSMTYPMSYYLINPRRLQKRATSRVYSCGTLTS